VTPRRILLILTFLAAVLVGLGIFRLTLGDGQASVRVTTSGRPELSIPLPAFSLVDQDGRPFTPAALRGRVWIVSFFFTRCPTICPRLTAKMGELVEATSGMDDLAFASISVDPENDPPAVLRAYGTRHGADFARWWFVTGDQKALEETVVSGFKLALARDDVGAIVHAERFVLVDAEGRIRGYFDADEPGQRDLLDAARRLVDAL